MKQPEIIIHSVDELSQLLKKSFFSLSREGKIKLDTDKIEHNKKLYWEEQLADYYYDCGCAQGSMSMIFGIMGILTWHRYHSHGFNFSWSMIISYSITVIVISFTGKFTALYLTRRKLKRLVEKIQQEWQESEKKTSSLN